VKGLRKDKKCANRDVTATHAMVRDLYKRVEGVDHKLCMDYFFSSLDLFDDLTTKEISICRTVRPDCKGLPQCLPSTRLGLKGGRGRHLG
jgi:hypothetical protein